MKSVNICLESFRTTSQTHQFLCTSWVNSNTRIEILLCRAHLQRYTKPLHHLTTAQAEDMKPHNLLLRTCADNLHLSGILSPLLGREDVVEHSGELRVVHLDILLTVLSLCLGLRETSSANFRMPEDD